MDYVIKIINKLGQRNDLVLAIFLVMILGLIILPMPTFLVDFLIALNMGLSTILLMTAIYLKSPLEFSSFPAVLLVTTLFRLALSITTTRLILLQADAGQIVYTFGNFVVGGDLIVGVVIFLIITIVQFLVITKGSERVAEVSARFSLDGMPGKQMSIDADMRAGSIEMEEAQRRRELVQKESQMYGAMDGAMKFVKGDAIAGLIIIFVNITAGVAIGSGRGMPAGEALQLYAILTVGDGLISQIPALLISITSGIIVTRVSNEDQKDLGSEIGIQLTNQPKALMVGGGFLLCFALIPGFPSMIFLLLALVIGGGGFLISYNLKKRRHDEDQVDLSALSPATDKPKKPGEVKSKLDKQEEFAQTLPLIIDVPTTIQSHLDTVVLNGELLKVRKALYMDLGVPFPGIHLRFNESMADNTYRILLQEVPVAAGTFNAEYFFVRESVEHLELLKIPYDTAEEFLPGLDTIWVSTELKDTLERHGIHFMDCASILTFHLGHVLKKYAEEFIGIQESRYLLEKMESSFAELVKEVQRLLPINKITEIFQRLVSEDISIRNLRAIMQALIVWGNKEKEVVQLTEYVRSSLKRFISYKYSNGKNMLPVYLLDQDIEELVRAGIRQTSAGSYLAIDPQTTAKFVQHVKEAVGRIAHLEHKPVLITAMDIRRYVRKLIEQDLYDLAVLSHQELTDEITVQPLGRISMR